MRSFLASLIVASAVANHQAEELTAITVDQYGYGLNVWAVTGKLNFDSQNIDTWFFGLELTTPLGEEVTDPSAKAKDLGTDASKTYVGQNGNVYQTYVQFDNPNKNSSSDPSFESFNCSRTLSVSTDAQEFEIEDEEGYPKMVYVNVTSESVGPATVQNFYGNRVMNENGIENNYNWENQLAQYSATYPSNRSDRQLWFQDDELNSTVFLQQGYRSGSRKYNCVAQRSLEDSRSIIPSLVPASTDLTFYAGYRIYDTTSSTVNTLHNNRSVQLRITVMDNAIAMTAGAIVAATAMLAF